MTSLKEDSTGVSILYHAPRHIFVQLISAYENEWLSPACTTMRAICVPGTVLLPCSGYHVVDVRLIYRTAAPRRNVLLLI